ncbi:MAG: hypothetical protein LBK63_08400 [Treponema sp.]|jgi:hypothetical protein|nr:hypothetical protein [Treponema sp.]
MLDSIKNNKILVELFNKLIAIRDALKNGGRFARRQDLEAETAAREAYDQQQDAKLQTMNGHYYPLDGYDFGKSLDVKTPNPDDVALLITYAMTMEGVVNPADIIEGTVIKNEFDGVEFVWNAATQAWLDWGIGNIVTSGNDHLGVVEGTADPGDGSKDGFVTVLSGGPMKTIGFAELKTVVGDIDAALDLIIGETA